MTSGFLYAGCGEWNETVVDASVGMRQSYVEDCQVVASRMSSESNGTAMQGSTSSPLSWSNLPAVLLPIIYLAIDPNSAVSMLPPPLNISGGTAILVPCWITEWGDGAAF
jgi:Cysteine-rich CPXCG